MEFVQNEKAMQLPPEIPGGEGTRRKGKGRAGWRD